MLLRQLVVSVRSVRSVRAVRSSSCPEHLIYIRRGREVLWEIKKKCNTQARGAGCKNISNSIILEAEELTFISFAELLAFIYSIFIIQYDL